MEKKDYINNIIQAANKVLEHEELVTDLGGSIEELFWDIVIPESVRDKLSEHEDELDDLELWLYRLEGRLSMCDDKPESFRLLSQQSKKVRDCYCALKQDINWYAKCMSSEDVLAIRSIMGQVKLLRDTLIWVGNGD